ncbi:NAD(+) diphosphatase [Halopseudomonas laoshanensis]|uniref:NAD-capped RNA hydrolase NudC n=1 Tax=Halopseudomonas laoshanensis TaxID=2268758 RepID=A0A7V7GS58_9GAMM|nr:NAD(+) diphosphatase [Halopseudomonas laoshanensis]KAA0693549.1 NAD(+) diphosphatase [Halopseudomonas laoshanensis]
MKQSDKRFIAATRTAKIQDNDLVVVFHEQKFAMYQGRFLHDPDSMRFLGNTDFHLLIGHLDNTACHLLRISDPVDLPGLSWHGLRTLIGQVDDDVYRLLGLAQQLEAWYDSHRFCGRCGATMQPRGEERAMECSACDLRQYPKLAPCIIVLITRGDEVLLARSPHFRPGFFSTLAGFIEPGESVEECLHREVMEEVGVEVDQLEYLGSQNWPFPNSLMMGFHARYVSGDIVPQPGEIEEAGWWYVDDLPGIPPPGSISRWLIDCHLARRRGQPLPPVPA